MRMNTNNKSYFYLLLFLLNDCIIPTSLVIFNMLQDDNNVTAYKDEAVEFEAIDFSSFKKKKWNLTISPNKVCN